jgi:geranylgeranyl diphosphate synthase type II
VSFDLEQAMGAARARVDARLAALLTGGPPALLDAMRYALLGGGKRFRPILCLWTHDMLQGDEHEAALDVGCAFECVHAYSLVHDDLPCMDDDALRRGRPTVHVRFGEAVAILCGDALLNLGYETVLGASWRKTARALPVARALADAASHRGLLGGQVLDLESEGVPPTADRLDAIHRAKTGALIRAALVAGGLAAGAGADDLARLGRAGDALGLAFQIADDVLDVTAAAAAIGKTPGKDAGAGKVTFPAVYGVERSRDLARAQAETARAELVAWPASTPLRALAAFCVERAS